MNCVRKILTYERLIIWRKDLRQKQKLLVVTNGCFDLLHAGHVSYLETARNLGAALLVGVNSDTAVRVLKGKGRPINCEADRAFVLAALECVDAVFIFPEIRATDFLALAQPDIYVKGGDYTIDTLDQDERRTVETAGGRIVIIPFVPGKSTTNIINRMKDGASSD